MVVSVCCCTSWKSRGSLVHCLLLFLPHLQTTSQQLRFCLLSNNLLHANCKWSLACKLQVVNHLEGLMRILLLEAGSGSSLVVLPKTISFSFFWSLFWSLIPTWLPEQCHCMQDANAQSFIRLPQQWHNFSRIAWFVSWWHRFWTSDFLVWKWLPRYLFRYFRNRDLYNM